MECEYCKISFSTKYNLTAHLKKSKTCLKLRGLGLESNFICVECNSVFANKINLSVHTTTCKKYILKKTEEEHETTIKKIKEEHETIIKKIRKEFEESEQTKEKELLNLLDEKDRNFKNIQIEHKNSTESYDMVIIQLKESHQREIETNENIIKDLQSQNEKLMLTIEKLASQAIDKTQTNITTHHTNNNSRNIYSDKYLLGNISEEFVQRKCQNYLTPQLFMEGQKGIAKLCTTHITQTPDKKVLLKCTDASRKKFKYIDEHGNIIEDYDARAFIEKVFQPIKKVTDIIYNTMVGDIEEEQENTEEDDYDRKSQLHDKLFKIMDCYARIINIDNPNQNSEFRTELAILNK